MADLVLFLIIGAMALWGMKSGLIKTIFHFGYYIIASAVAMYLYPILSNYLLGSKISEFIHQKVILPKIAVNTADMAMPVFMSRIIKSGIENTTESIAATLTAMVLNIICFVGIFLIVKIGLRLTANLLNSIAKLPVLSAFNKFGGLIAGAANGILISYVALAVIAAFADGKLQEAIIASKYASVMYNNNLILKIIFG
ncbi:MAG: CvpA family protein [Firmicutes bacterium]|nr:CvpA family protein [Bacillota bacterium]